MQLRYEKMREFYYGKWASFGGEAFKTKILKENMEYSDSWDSNQLD